MKLTLLRYHLELVGGMNCLLFQQKFHPVDELLLVEPARVRHTLTQRDASLSHKSTPTYCGS